MSSFFSRGWYNLEIIVLHCYFKLYYITGVNPSLKHLFLKFLKVLSSALSSGD